MKSNFKLKLKIFLIMSLFISILGYATKENQVQFSPPSGFIKEKNYLVNIMPTQFVSERDKKISIIIPPSYKLADGVPMTKEGKLNNNFLIGKKNFNTTFGIEEWHLANYKFSKEGETTLLELVGSYKSNSGRLTSFIENHYFSKDKRVESIHLIYDEDSKPELVKEAKNSLTTYKPSFQ